MPLYWLSTRIGRGWQALIFAFHSHLALSRAAARVEHCFCVAKHEHGGLGHEQGAIGDGADPEQILQSWQLLHVPQLAQLQFPQGWQLQKGPFRTTHGVSIAEASEAQKSRRGV